MMELCWRTYPEGAVYLKKLLVPLSRFFFSLLSSLISLSPFPSLPLSPSPLLFRTLSSSLSLSLSYDFLGFFALTGCRPM